MQCSASDSQLGQLVFLEGRRRELTYDLSKLGWKAFQDLATAVAADVLNRPVQTFLRSNDGGRDGAFIGQWDGPDGVAVKSTIQCKFSEKTGSNLSLSDLAEELSKA